MPNYATGNAIQSAYTGSVGTVVNPSGDTTGVTDATAITTAISKLPATGGVVTLAPTGQWYIKCGSVVVSKGTGVYINAPGGVYINAVGAGDVIRFYDSSTYGTRNPTGGGGITGFPVIDGTSTTGNSSAIHAGDVFQMVVEAQAQNFTAGTTSKGFWFDNNYYWTEQAHLKLFSENSTQLVVFDNSANTSGFATGSFDRAWGSIGVNDTGGQDCVAFKNGAFIVDVQELTIYGNAATTVAANTAAVLRFSNNSVISNGPFSVGVELGGSTNAPSTIAFGTTASGSGIAGCSGVIDFSAHHAFVASNLVTQGVFQFYGPVYGDATLIGQVPLQGVRTVTASTYTASISADFLINCDTTSNNVTITLPDATTCKGQAFYIKCIQSNNSVVINTTSSQTVDGQASGFWNLGNTSELLGVISDGSNWQSVTGVGIANILALLTGTTTRLSAAASTPALSTGVAARVNNSVDVMLYANITTTSVFSLAIGSTSAASTVIMASGTVTAPALISVRLPAAYFVKSTFTGADVTWTAVTC